MDGSNIITANRRLVGIVNKLYLVRPQMSEQKTDSVVVDVQSETIQPPILKRAWKSLVTSWNVKANFIAIFVRPEQQMKPLDGIRALGFLWVLLIHSWKALQIGADPNDKEMLQQLHDSHTNWDFFSRLADKGGYGVDMFFVLSGFLIAYILIREYNKSSEDTSGNIFTRTIGINIPRFFLRRALRIIPVYWLTIALIIGLGFLFPAGSFMRESVAMTCVKKGYLNLLFVNNLFGTSYNTMCLVPSWSIAVEIQMYLMSPIIVYLMCKKRILAYLVPCTLIVASSIMNLVISIVYNCDSEDAFESDTCKTVLYEKVYTKWNPYLWGMIAAYIYIHYFEKQQQPILSELASKYRRLSLYSFYIAAAIAMITVVLLNYDRDAPPIVRFMDYAIGRTLFGLVISFILLSCLIGSMKIINSILSLWIFYPIGQLSYTGYLLQFIVIVSNYQFLFGVKWIGVGHGALFVHNLINTILTLILCIPIHVFVERPFMNMRW
jgi:peptidoglycan/LPS O-acetylase OafA/YrhL